jgi:hypothetical protein
MKSSIKRVNGASFFSRSLVGLLLVLLLLLSVSPGVSNAASASGLSISPLRQNLTLNSGQAGEVSITLKNITGGPVIAKAKVQDFESDGVTGNPKIISNPNQVSSASIRNFLVGLGDVRLATGQQVSFTIPVQAPNNAAPGAYYGLIEYQAVPVDSSGSPTGNSSVVALSAAVSQLVFITVPGKVSDHAQINAIDIYSDKAGTNAGIFFTHPPKMVGVAMQNVGNAFVTPFGNVTLQNTEHKSVYSYELNGGITRGLMLPNSTRIFKNQIQNITRPGRYTVAVSASYGNGSVILVGTKSFWYIPIWLLIIFIVIILALIGVVWWIRRRYKRTTNRHNRQ